jgi:hypothetical protein
MVLNSPYQLAHAFCWSVPHLHAKEKIFQFCCGAISMVLLAEVSNPEREFASFLRPSFSKD